MDQDFVAAIVAEWSRERPDLDVEPMLLLGRVEHLAERFAHALREALRAEHATIGEYDLLAALRRAGMPFALSPTQLVARTGVTAGAVTKRVDGLEHRGLVERRVVDADARGRVVTLTASGLQLVDRLIEVNVELQRRIVGDLSAQEIGVLCDLLARVNSGVDDIAGPPTSPR